MGPTCCPRGSQAHCRRLTAQRPRSATSSPGRRIRPAPRPLRLRSLAVAGSSARREDPRPWTSGFTCRRSISGARGSPCADWQTLWMLRSNGHLLDLGQRSFRVLASPGSDGPTALAAVLDRSADLSLLTSVSLPTLRGPVPVAKALAALDVLSSGRSIAGLGPGSSPPTTRRSVCPSTRDGDASMRRFHCCGIVARDPCRLRGVLDPVPPSVLSPLPQRPDGVPLWLEAGGRPRASAVSHVWVTAGWPRRTTRIRGSSPHIRTSSASSSRARAGRGRRPHALVDDVDVDTRARRRQSARFAEVVAPMVKRDPAVLRGRICVGSAQSCADLL